jgi:hypothetical protein
MTQLTPQAARRAYPNEPAMSVGGSRHRATAGGYELVGLEYLPADRGLESGFELFYVLRLTQTVSLMPDLQYWHRNDRDGPGARSWVLGFRADFEF